MESIVYHALGSDPGNEEIRLLKIALGSRDDPIECELQTVSLSSNTDYSALSYVWGEPQPTKTIICNGSNIEVGINLFAALNRLRDRMRHDDEEELVLWVDAICINQRNNAEKGRQVQMMRQIYEKAHTTYIWLGEDEEDTWRAFGLLRTLNKVKEAQEAAGDKRLFFELGPKGQQAYGLPNMLDQAYKSLSAFLRRTWFTRVWIIQELAVSRNPIIWCGDEEVKWDFFFDAIQHAQKLILPIWDNATRVQRIFELGTVRMSVANGKMWSLLDLLLVCRPFNSKDPRDKIYALCGLASDAGEGALDIKPDYDKPVNDLYKEIALLMMQKNGSPNVLSVPRVPKASPYLELAGLPSWVPDWTVSNDCMSLRSPGTTYDFQASDESTAFNICQNTGNSAIKLSGFVVTSIQEIGDIHSLQGEDGLDMFGKLKQVPKEQAVFNVWERICKLQSGSTYVPTGESIQNAYWQTLVAGKLSGGFDEAKKGYLQWDQVVRSHFRHLPNFKYFGWVNTGLAVPSMVKMTWDMMKQSSSFSPQPSMVFRSDMTVAGGRRFFKTEKGHIGLGPSLAKEGDFIVLIKGVKVPLILRRIGKGEGWELIGDSYIHGVMRGEEFDLDKCVDMWIGSKPA